MRISEDTKLDFQDVLLVPQWSELHSRKDVEIERKFLFKHSQKWWSGIPVISANLFNTGTFEMAKEFGKKKMMVALHKHYSVGHLQNFYLDNEKLYDYVFYTMGISDKEYEKFCEVSKGLRVPVHMVCFDIANGHMEKFGDVIKRFRFNHPNVTIAAGNVVTPDMTKHLIMCGADIIKVGIGSGSLCTTRLVAGVGYPQLSAIIECANAAHNLQAHIISDGGIVNIGDIPKAFCANADFVMSGGLFCGYDENGGEWELQEVPTHVEKVEVWRKKKLKIYGMASKTANEKFAGGLSDYRAVEGRETTISYKGKVEIILQEIEGGLRSCGAYIGAKRLKDFPKCANFIRVSRVHHNITP